MKDYKSCTTFNKTNEEPLLTSMFGGLVLVSITAVISFMAVYAS